MTNNYLSNLINAFDEEFESLVIPFPRANLYVEETVDVVVPETTEYSSEEKLQRIEALATEISAERYSPNYNPEICLANLLNCILSKDANPNFENDFFQLLNQERNVNLTDALNEFDFFLDNPYKKKAEKILSKIEARKNR